jgi:hypothetical protein
MRDTISRVSANALSSSSTADRQALSHSGPVIVALSVWESKMAKQIEGAVESLDAAEERRVPVSFCQCGNQAEYSCGSYQLCESCSWALAEAGGAP